VRARGYLSTDGFNYHRVAELLVGRNLISTKSCQFQTTLRLYDLLFAILCKGPLLIRHTSTHPSKMGPLQRLFGAVDLVVDCATSGELTSILVIASQSLSAGHPFVEDPPKMSEMAKNDPIWRCEHTSRAGHPHGLDIGTS